METSGPIKADHTDSIFVSGAMSVSRLEITNADNLVALVKAKAASMSRSFERTLVDEINRRGWGLIEYRENTTGL